LSGLSGYGLEWRYDPEIFAFAGVLEEAGIPGDGAALGVLADRDGLLALAAYGGGATTDAVELTLRFRPLAAAAASPLRLVGAAVRQAGEVKQLAGTTLNLETLPAVYGLAANYPNPFNPQTTLRYELPEAAAVRLEVFNAAGQRVRILVDGDRAAGRHAAAWDATDEGGRKLAAGVYFYRLQAGSEFVRTRKMILVK
jgi:hypothetical protein